MLAIYPIFLCLDERGSLGENMKRFGFIVVVLPLVLMGGCVTRAVREHQAELCKDLASLTSAIAIVRSVKERAPVSELQQAETLVTEAFQRFKARVQNDPETSQEANLEEVEKAYESLDKSIQELPEKSTVAQARNVIVDKVVIMESALFKAKSGLRCPSDES